MTFPVSTVNSSTSIKSVGEALSYAECALLNFYPEGRRRDMYAKIIADLLADVRRQRPVGPDGKHGNRHTETCGCGTEPCEVCGGVGWFPDDTEGEEGRACTVCLGRGRLNYAPAKS